MSRLFVRPMILAALESADAPIPTGELATRVYGSGDEADVRALQCAIYNLRRCRPDLKIESIGQVKNGNPFGPVAYRLMKS